MPIKCDVKCDNIVKDNLIDLTNKNSSNPILIKENITQIENIKKKTILKIMSLVLQVKVFHIMFWIIIKKMGCDFLNKYVLKPFNETSRNEEHLNNFVQLMKENTTSKTKK